MASSTKAPGTVAAPPKEGIPNRTLYLNNLNDKLPKEDLKRNLYMLFATYGVIIDIVALKTAKMRGQAHIAFRDVDSATQAMRALQNFIFFGKEMRIAYAKTKSDSIAKLDGSYKMPVPERDTHVEEIAAPAGFGAVPEKAVPVNAPDAAAGQKRAREEEEEEEDDDAEMEMDVSDEDSD